MASVFKGNNFAEIDLSADLGNHQNLIGRFVCSGRCIALQGNLNYSRPCYRCHHQSRFQRSRQRELEFPVARFHQRSIGLFFFRGKRKPANALMESPKFRHGCAFIIHYAPAYLHSLAERIHCLEPHRAC